jgi:hypothetical protein
MPGPEDISERIGGASTPQEPLASTSGSPLRALLVAGAIAAIWFTAAGWRIVTDSVVPWDSKNQFYAFFRFLAATLHSGASPFWNPYHYGGHPSVADPQSLIFSPFFLLWAAFDPAPTIRTFDLIVSAHLLAGGLAMAAIGWRARWPAAACVLAAVLFMFGGAAAGRLQHTGIILSYSLFPLALLLLQVALQRRSLAYAILFSFVAAALALGRNQVSLLLCFVLIAAAIGEIAGTPRPLRYLRERLPVLVTMAVVGAALVAVPVLLTLQFAALSNRPAELLDAALKGSLYPVNLATLVVADMFGTHTAYWGPGGTSLPEVAYTDDSFNYMFVGSVPVVLLLWFGVVGGGAWRRSRRLITAVLAISLLFMLGRYTPVFAWAFDFVPAIGMFRRPVDANFVFGVAMAILAGHLLADYVRDGPPAPRIWRSAIVAAGALAILVWAVIFSRQSGRGAGRGGQDRAHSHSRHRPAGSRERSARTHHGCRRGDGHRGRRIALLERGLSSQRGKPWRLRGARAARGCRCTGNCRPRTGTARGSRAGRLPARRGSGNGRPMAKSGGGARLGGDQRLQPPAHRIL